MTPTGHLRKREGGWVKYKAIHSLKRNVKHFAGRFVGQCELLEVLSVWTSAAFRTRVNDCLRFKQINQLLFVKHYITAESLSVFVKALWTEAFLTFWTCVPTLLWQAKKNPKNKQSVCLRARPQLAKHVSLPLGRFDLRVFFVLLKLWLWFQEQPFFLLDGDFSVLPCSSTARHFSNLPEKKRFFS